MPVKLRTVSRNASKSRQGTCVSMECAFQTGQGRGEVAAGQMPVKHLLRLMITKSREESERFEPQFRVRLGMTALHR